MRFAILNLLMIPTAAWAQAQETKPVFEAASVKPAGPMQGHSHSHSSPGLLQSSMTLKRYIMMAYDVKEYQVTGGPNWMDLDGYAIVAKLENRGEEGLPGKDTPRLRAAAEVARMNAALQALLAERFQLKIHRETKSMPAYGLTVAKSGFKLKQVTGEGGSGTSSNGSETGRKMTGTRVGMTTLAAFLSRQMDRPVTDQTHIQGFYIFTLEWTPDDLKGSSSDAARGPSIFTALQELGLKLEPQKAPVEIIVVDSAEKPTGN
jgi:uncharacterized protein (TIGR03435 family)